MTTTETIKCPCCGGPTLDTGRVRVSLDENVLWFGDRAVPLTRRLSALAFILARRMPATVSHEAIVQQMFGAVSTEWAQTNVWVAVNQLRKVLRPIGLDVVNAYDTGYSLAVVSRTERFTTTEAARAQA